MAAKRTHDVIANAGEYTDGQGQQKKRWVKCGSAFTQDDGRISIKLDAVPVGPDWSGWLSLAVPQEQGHGGGQQAQRSQAQPTQGGFRPQLRPMARQQMPPAQPTQEIGEDDIPF